MIIHSHEYDSGYYPAMPMMEIQVLRRAGQPSLALTAIVDSGADATLIPLRHLRQLKARKGSTGWLVGLTGGRYEVDLYTVGVQIGGQPPQYIDVVGTEGRGEAVVGRDLLNQYIVTLNAPGNSVEVST
jgi:predicted aspartyl protease